MSKFAALYETRTHLNNLVNYTGPLSFNDWNKRPHSEKAALLFLQFFNEILTAWDKANNFDFIEGEEGVSIVLQYLEKNVSIIEDSPKRFKPAYIYRVAYNCMYCICHDLQSVKNRWENETPGTIIHNGEELSLFDTVLDVNESVDDLYLSNMFEDEFWSVIEDAGLGAEKVMRYLLSGDAVDLKKINPRSKRYKDGDPLRDVEVPLEAVEAVLERIKAKFLQLPQSSPCGSYVARLLSANA